MNKIILKKSSVAGKMPEIADLAYGELALNYKDGVIYYKSADNEILPISNSNGTVQLTQTNDDFNYPLVFSSSNSTLLIDGSGGTYNPSTNTASINISGVAEKAKTLETPREIRLNGSLLGSALFDGSQNIIISASIKPNIELQTGPILIENTYQIDTTTSGSTQNTQFQVDVFDVSEYRTAKYLAQVSSGMHFHSTEILVVHNDISAFITEYGTVYTSETPLGFFDVTVDSGEVKLLFTPSAANTNVRVIRHTIRVS